MSGCSHGMTVLCSLVDSLQEDKHDHSASLKTQPSKQKFWSLSHGFKMGRSLAKWGSQEDTEAEPMDLYDEDLQIQEAVQKSLEDAGLVKIWMYTMATFYALF